jgi:Glycosyl hydrolase family 20, catalytic domain
MPTTSTSTTPDTAVSERDGAPAFAYRAVHLDFRSNCLRPTMAYLHEALDLLAEAGYNAVVIEWEDKFPYAKHPELATKETFSRREMAELVDHADRLGLATIPLIQSLGHVEYILKKPEYAALRERTGDISQFCPSEPGSFEVLRELVDELIDASPNTPYIHLGGDETWLLGSCPRCSARAAQQDGLLGLYVDHMAKLVTHARDRGRIPLMWGDIILGDHVSGLPDGQWPEESRKVLGRLGSDVRMVYWDYNGLTPGDFRRFDDFERAGHPVWVAPTTRSSDIVPDYTTHLANISSFLEAGREHGAEGAFITSWAWKNMPEELTWHGLLTGAERAWNSADLPQETLDLRVSEQYFGVELPGFVEAISLLSYDYWKEPYIGADREPIWSSYLTMNPGQDFAIPEPAAVRERALKAERLLTEAQSQAQRHASVLATWAAGAALVAHTCRKQLLFARFEDVVKQPAKQLDREGLAALRDEIQTLATEREEIADRWAAALLVQNIDVSVQRDRVLRFGGERTFTAHALEQLEMFLAAEGRRAWR